MREGELSFINISGPPSRNAQARNKTVRAHVMRRYKRQQREETRKRAIVDFVSVPASQENISEVEVSPESSGLTDVLIEEVSSSSTHTSSGLEASSELVEHATCNDGASLALAHQSGDTISGYHSGLFDLRTSLDHNLDPFSFLPIRSTPRSLMLLQQNVTSPIRTSVHADPIGLYRQLCSKDPAWLFMNMFYAASRFPKATKQDVLESSNYLSQSMSAINESIVQSPNLISDSTIATVACLANIENLNGVASDASVHMNGLIRMVELRDGLKNLGMQGILRRIVLWSDLLYSSRSASAPRFPFQRFENAPHLSEFTPTASQSHYYIRFNQHLANITTVKHRIKISQILLSLHELSTFLNMTNVHELPWDAAYPDRVYEVEYYILVSLFDDRVVADLDDEVKIGSILLHSGLLYIYTNLRQTPVGGVIRRRLLSRLKIALDNVEVSSLTKLFPAEMLWVLFLGAFTATGADHIVYFTEKIRSVCFVNEIRTWLEIGELFDSVPALESRCLAKCMDLWRDITETMSIV